MIMRLWTRPAGFLRGDIVEVRGETEIAATLDASGRFDGLPFMPEMVPHCGRRFRIYRRADKTCVEGLGLRRMQRTVFLEAIRCDGAAHDGCQRGCLMFWKEAWLKPVTDWNGTGPAQPETGAAAPASLWARRLPTRDGERYICQSTALATATSDLDSRNPVHLVREMFTRELTPWRFVQIVNRAFINKIRTALKLREMGGLAGVKTRNPKGDLDLVPGERVEVKSPAEIMATLDPKGRNCGLSFEPDMTDNTGKRYEVATPITKIILEQTGRMATLTNTVALKGVTCQGLCSKNCPRNNPIFWRESWLRRLDPRAQRAIPAPPPLQAIMSASP